MTVAPASASMSVGDSLTFVATVNACAQTVDRTVTWSSSNPAVASVTSTGVVHGLTAGTASIIATSNADKTVSSAAVVTVGAAMPNGPSITISGINQTVCGANGTCTSVPANLQNVAGQLDVTFNLDVSTQTLQSIALVLNCTGNGNSGKDTVVATQSVNSSRIAAAALSAPITLSFNTAAFNPTTGASNLKNGTCTIKGQTVTLSGTTPITTISPTEQITLNNADTLVISPAVSTTPTAPQIASTTDNRGLLWNAGAVNVTAVPVLYTGGRSIASGSITLVNGGGAPALGKGGAVVSSQGVVAVSTGITPVNGLLTASFPNSTTASNGVGGATVDTLVVSVSTIDNAGNAGPSLVNPTVTNGGSTTIAGGAFIRLDNRAPDVTGTMFIPNTQNTSGGWVGANFMFSAAAGSLTLGPNTLGDANGVDKVTVQTQYAPSGTSSFAAFSTPRELAETPSSTGSSAYDLRVLACDALNNCAATGVLTTFGVDLTPPTGFTVSGPLPDEIVGIGQTLTHNDSISVSGSDPGSASGVPGSGFGSTPVLLSETRLAPSGSGQALTCVIGTPSDLGDCASPSVRGWTFTTVGTAPGQYTVTYIVVDQGGNQSPPVMLQYYVDQAAPAISGGIGVPATVTAGSAFNAQASDDMDVAGSNGILHYAIALGGVSPDTRILIPGTVSPQGLPFDNVLTRSALATISIPTSEWYRSLAAISGGVISSTVKPNQIGIRAVDAANNLSIQDQVALPPGNISSATGAPFTIGTDLNDFSVSASPTTVSNAGGSGPTATTLTATVIEPNATAPSPFSNVCFYVVTPSGTEGGQANAATMGALNDLSLIGCTATPVAATVGANAAYQYALSYDPPAAFGSAGNTLSIVAIGANANADALVTSTPAGVVLNP